MIDIQHNIPLAPFTTFKIGGNTKHFVQVDSKEAIKEALKWAKDKGEKFFILAGGSNILFADEGFDGLIIMPVLRGMSVDTKTGEATAQASVSLLGFIMRVCREGLSGMERMYGIPGTIGGAVRGNAGAFGTETQDVLKSVTALNTETLQERTFSNDECEFGYRQSFFKQNPQWLICSATFALTPHNANECVNEAKQTLATRNERQIQNVAAAGSFFMNPVASQEVQELFRQQRGEEPRGGKVPAGWLIEEAGLKGATEGGARVSNERANYIVNDKDATAKDVLMLAQKVKDAVKEQFNIELQEEVKIVDF